MAKKREDQKPVLGRRVIKTETFFLVEGYDFDPSEVKEFISGFIEKKMLKLLKFKKTKHFTSRDTETQKLSADFGAETITPLSRAELLDYLR